MSGVEALIARAAGAYERRFGARPTVAACAPGRVNLIGEHTDYTGGLALPMAIDRWCVAVMGPAADRSRCGVVACDLGDGPEEGEVAWLDLSRPLAENAGAGERLRGVERGGWLSYIAGVVEEFGAVAGRPAVNIAVASSVPIGSGLSSSAALEVAVATGLEGAAGAGLERLEKARLCQRAERRWVGVQCGLMDQLASVMGEEGSALLMDFAAETARPVRMPAGLAIVVANSGVRHELGSSEYGRRVESCERARVGLGVGSLRRATLGMVEGARGALDDEARRCARHVVSENERVVAAAAALERGDAAELGRLMEESHASLRDGYRVSCAELDALVEIAAGVDGVHGARMTGGGFGGCVVAAVEEGAVEGVVGAWSEGYPRRCGRACDVFVVRGSGGAGLVGV